MAKKNNTNSTVISPVQVEHEFDAKLGALFFSAEHPATEIEYGVMIKSDGLHYFFWDAADDDNGVWKTIEVGDMPVSILASIFQETGKLAFEYKSMPEEEEEDEDEDEDE